MGWLLLHLTQVHVSYSIVALSVDSYNLDNLDYFYSNMISSFESGPETSWPQVCNVSHCALIKFKKCKGPVHSLIFSEYDPLNKLLYPPVTLSGGGG